jgi:hypothetical protein
MRRLVAFAALVGFGFSLLVHIAALFGVDVSSRVPMVWVLHVGIFVVFIPLVFSSRKVLGPRPTFSEIRALFPGWVVLLGIAVFAYAAVNFLLFMVHTEGGSPSIRDGKYVLQSHGRLLREISSAEYVAFKANEVRGFSGHWLAFYYVSFAYFMFLKRPNPSIEGTASSGLRPPPAAPHVKR